MIDSQVHIASLAFKCQVNHIFFQPRFPLAFLHRQNENDLILSRGIFALRISAFGLSGAYERMWYWSAYQMEQQYVDAANRKIATSCKSSSFAQFVTWIADAADEDTAKSICSL